MAARSLSLIWAVPVSIDHHSLGAGLNGDVAARPEQHRDIPLHRQDVNFPVVGHLGPPHLQAELERAISRPAPPAQRPESSLRARPAHKARSDRHRTFTTLISGSYFAAGLAVALALFILKKYSGIAVSAPPRVASTGIPIFLANSPSNGLLPGR